MNALLKIVLSLVIVIGLISAYLGFSYVPNKHQANINSIKKEAGDKFNKTNKELSEVKVKQEQALSELTISKSELVTANTERRKYETNFNNISNQLVVVTKQSLDTQVVVNNAIKERNDIQQQLIAYQGFKKIAESFLEIGITPDEIKKKLKELDAKVENDKANKGGKMVVGISGTIRNIDPRYGFVVVDVGSLKGVKSAGLMTVTRGGQYVGEIKIHTVQPTISLANIVTSMTKVALKEGDVVTVKKDF